VRACLLVSSHRSFYNVACGGQRITDLRNKHEYYSARLATTPGTPPSVCPNSEVASQSHYWAVNIWCENTRNHSFNALYIVFLLYSCRIDAGEQWGCAPLTTVLPKTCLTMPDLGVAS
jgi:hypothetical protein